MTRLSVIVPTRFERQSTGGLYVDRAVHSIRRGAAMAQIEAEVVLGCDPGTVVPDLIHSVENIAFGKTASLPAALNAAVLRADGDMIAFLEDDDCWRRRFVLTARRCLGAGVAEFVSSTQIERDDATGEEIRINDFPTPSGWVMPRATFEKVGLFNEEYAVHQDNEWLGRLVQVGVRRAHLVERTAPVDPGLARMIRPWLAAAHDVGRAALVRHSDPVPLVVRNVRAESWMGQIKAGNPERAATSTRLIRELEARFGVMPW